MNLATVDLAPGARADVLDWCWIGALNGNPDRLTRQTT
jgi:hypothetical protein